MWISSKVYNNIVESNANLIQRVESLEESRNTMKKRIDTLASSARGIEYGERYLTYTGFGLSMPERKTKSVSDVIHYILNYLKLEITETKATEAIANLTKIKPIKSKKETKDVSKPKKYHHQPIKR